MVIQNLMQDNTTRWLLVTLVSIVILSKGRWSGSWRSRTYQHSHNITNKTSRSRNWSKVKVKVKVVSREMKQQIKRPKVHHSNAYDIQCSLVNTKSRYDTMKMHQDSPCLAWKIKNKRYIRYIHCLSQLEQGGWDKTRRHWGWLPTWLAVSMYCSTHGPYHPAYELGWAIAHASSWGTSPLFLRCLGPHKPRPISIAIGPCCSCSQHLSKHRGSGRFTCTAKYARLRPHFITH